MNEVEFHNLISDHFGIIVHEGREYDMESGGWSSIDQARWREQWTQYLLRLRFSEKSEWARLCLRLGVVDDDIKSWYTDVQAKKMTLLSSIIAAVASLLTLLFQLM